MKYKASLHLHTNNDLEDSSIIKYSIYDLIDEAQRLGFKVLALTTHKKFVFKTEFSEYAKNKGILLITGIEAEIDGWHCLILNCDQTVEQLKTINDLIVYKKNHPNCFVIAPHPNYKSKSIGLKLLEKYQEVFDAIEYSWFYSSKFNLNAATAILAKKINKPMIATSDLHRLEYLNVSYAIIYSERLEITAIFQAIRENKFENVSQPQPLWKLISFFMIMLSNPSRLLKKINLFNN